jgi:hypothetical protein
VGELSTGTWAIILGHRLHEEEHVAERLPSTKTHGQPIPHSHGESRVLGHLTAPEVITEVALMLCLARYYRLLDTVGMHALPCSHHPAFTKLMLS